MLTQVNILSAFLYLRNAESMPEPVLTGSGFFDRQADNAAIEEWSSRTSDFEVETDRIERFILRTDRLLDELMSLELDESEPPAPQYMSLFYEAAKDVFDHDRAMIRTYFLWLYLVMFQREDGPRWGEFVAVYGPAEFNRLARQRFSTLV